MQKITHPDVTQRVFDYGDLIPFEKGEKVTFTIGTSPVTAGSTAPYGVIEIDPEMLTIYIYPIAGYQVQTTVINGILHDEYRGLRAVQLKDINDGDYCNVYFEPIP